MADQYESKNLQALMSSLGATVIGHFVSKSGRVPVLELHLAKCTAQCALMHGDIQQRHAVCEWLARNYVLSRIEMRRKCNHQNDGRFLVVPCDCVPYRHRVAGNLQGVTKIHS